MIMYFTLNGSIKKNREWMDYGENDADSGSALQAIGFKNSTKEYVVYTVRSIHRQSKNYFYNFCKIYQQSFS